MMKVSMSQDDSALVYLIALIFEALRRSLLVSFRDGTALWERLLLDACEDGLDPSRVFAVLEHLKSFRETEVSHDIDWSMLARVVSKNADELTLTRRAIIVLEQVHRFLGLSLLHQLVLHFASPLLQHGFKFLQGLVRKGV